MIRDLDGDYIFLSQYSSLTDIKDWFPDEDAQNHHCF
jgi:hypothetical protein